MKTKHDGVCKGCAKGMRVAFVDGQVLMWPKGKTFDDAIVIGEQEGGLYKLKGQPDQALVHDTVEPNELWHRRLAHVHYRALPLARKAIEGLPEIQAKHEGVCTYIQIQFHEIGTCSDCSDEMEDTPNVCQDYFLEWCSRRGSVCGEATRF